MSHDTHIICLFKEFGHILNKYQKYENYSSHSLNCSLFIVSIMQKYKYNLLQYESAKYLLFIPTILIKMITILIKIS